MGELYPGKGSKKKEVSEETYIDPYDIEVLQHWLKLAKTKGTKAIRIVASPSEVYGKYGATHLVTIVDILNHLRRGLGK